MNKKLNHNRRSVPLIGMTLLGLLYCPANAALVHHWTFDEGIGDIAGDSAGGNDGAISGASWDSDGVRSSFLTFAGTDNHVDPNLTFAAQTNTSNFTWAGWVNVGDGNGNHIIMGNRKDGNNTDYSPRQFIKFTIRQFEWHQNGNGNDNVDYEDLASGGGWQHLAVVKNGTSLETFLDGVSTGTGTLTEPLDSAVPMRFFIGGEPNQGAGEHFTGGIDDVRIYDNALSSGEIGRLAGIPEPSSFLLAIIGLGAGCLRRKR